MTKTIYEKNAARQKGCLRRPYKIAEKTSKSQRRKGKIVQNSKAFLSEQCKEIKENNTMGKTRDRFRKVGDTKGLFHAKISTVKDRKGKDITEAKDTKKRWQKYTSELYS